MHPDLAAHLGPNAPATLAAYHPDRAVSDGYVRSYATSKAIEHEHLRDAATLAATLKALPDFSRHLAHLARAGQLAALDTCAGEAAKTLTVARDLYGELDSDRFVLHAEEPDARQLAELARRTAGSIRYGVHVNVLAVTLQDLLAQLAAGARLDPPPAYVTNLHGVYYLEQVDGLIPMLAALGGLTGGLVCVIVEADGDLQNLKAHMAQRGLGPPATPAMVAATFQAAGIPQAPPIRIPNRSWQVDRALPPEVMFDRHFRFLLDGNWGSRPLEPEDLAEAGRYLQAVAQPRHTPVGTLDADDLLFVAGRWLVDHPADLEALVRLAHPTGRR
jgi:hypothetical protein